MALPRDRLGPAEAFGQPPRTGRDWFDLLAASAAIFISVVSLVVAFRGERTQRGLLAANSWPFVQLSEDMLTDYGQFDVENAGVGPAKIMSFEVFYKGQAMASPIALLRACCGLPVPAPGTAQPPLGGFAFGEVYNNVLRPGEHIIALRLTKHPETVALVENFKREMSNMSFRTCYCSVLGECWTSNLRDLTQNKMATCPVPAHQFAEAE